MSDLGEKISDQLKERPEGPLLLTRRDVEALEKQYPQDGYPNFFYVSSHPLPIPIVLEEQ